MTCTRFVSLIFLSIPTFETPGGDGDRGESPRPYIYTHTLFSIQLTKPIPPFPLSPRCFTFYIFTSKHPAFSFQLSLFTTFLSPWVSPSVSPPMLLTFHFLALFHLAPIYYFSLLFHLFSLAHLHFLPFWLTLLYYYYPLFFNEEVVVVVT